MRALDVAECHRIHAVVVVNIDEGLRGRATRQTSGRRGCEKKIKEDSEDLGKKQPVLE